MSDCMRRLDFLGEFFVGERGGKGVHFGNYQVFIFGSNEHRMYWIFIKSKFFGLFSRLFCSFSFSCLTSFLFFSFLFFSFLFFSSLFFPN